MGETLTGKTPAATYGWLMHMSEDGPLDAETPRTISLGKGQDTPLSVTTTGLFVGGTAVSLVGHVHDAAAVTTGIFDVARIPDLAASKITSGTFDAARIPDGMAEAKISGLTANLAARPGIKEVTAGMTVNDRWVETGWRYELAGDAPGDVSIYLTDLSDPVGGAPTAEEIEFVVTNYSATRNVVIEMVDSVETYTPITSVGPGTWLIRMTWFSFLEQWLQTVQPLSDLGSIYARKTADNVFVLQKNTMSQSSVDKAGLNLPPGVAPTSPVNGDVWPTTNAIFIHLDGATRELALKHLTAQLSGGNTFSGTQTMTGQLELAGQALTNGTSAVNRDLGDARYGRMLRARKTTDDARTNTDTLAADADLVLPMEANTNYLFELLIIYRCQTTVSQGIKISLTGPTGHNISGILDCFVSGAVSTVGRAFRSVASGIGNPRGVANGNTGAEASITVRGFVQTSATAGNFVLEWAQNTADANFTRLEQGSYLTLLKV